MIGRDTAEGLRIQGRVIVALMLREARTRYGRTRAGYLWAILEPVLHISAFAVLFSFRWVTVPLGDSALLFLATGFSLFIGFRHVMQRTEGGYGSNAALLSFPIVQIIDVFISRALLELATWSTVTILMFSALIITGVAPPPNDIIEMLQAFVALFCVAFGLGISLGIISQFVPSLHSVMGFPMRLLYLGSGVFYLPDPMPPAFRNILAWNPVMHAITLFREGYYRGYESHILDRGYLYSCAAGFVLLGLVAEKVARKPLRTVVT